MFDFLIDIVPREEAASHAKRTTGQPAPSAASAQIPQQHVQQTHQAMPPPGYDIGHGLAPDQDYRQQSSLYNAQVQPGPAAPYGAPEQQMYPDQMNIGQGMYYAPQVSLSLTL